MNSCAPDILAYFARPGTGNGPIKAVNGRIKHLGYSALGVRNLADYITRSLPEAVGLRLLVDPQTRRAPYLPLNGKVPEDRDLKGLGHEGASPPSADGDRTRST